jgi:hypothetical protein
MRTAPSARSFLVLGISLGLTSLVGGLSGCKRRELLTDATVPDGGVDANDWDGGTDAAVESVVLYPTEREIVIRDGVIPRITLEVRARYGEGSAEVVLPATFTVTPGRLAVLDGDRELVPTGVAGGEARACASRPWAPSVVTCRPRPSPCVSRPACSARV